MATSLTNSMTARKVPFDYILNKDMWTAWRTLWKSYSHVFTTTPQTIKQMREMVDIAMLETGIRPGVLLSLSPETVSIRNFVKKYVKTVKEFQGLNASESTMGSCLIAPPETCMDGELRLATRLAIGDFDPMTFKELCGTVNDPVRVIFRITAMCNGCDLPIHAWTNIIRSTAVDTAHSKISAFLASKKSRFEWLVSLLNGLTSDSDHKISSIVVSSSYVQRGEHVLTPYTTTTYLP